MVCTWKSDLHIDEKTKMIYHDQIVDAIHVFMTVEVTTMIIVPPWTSDFNQCAINDANAPRKLMYMWRRPTLSSTLGHLISSRNASLMHDDKKIISSLMALLDQFHMNVSNIIMLSCGLIFGLGIKDGLVEGKVPNIHKLSCLNWTRHLHLDR